MHKTRKFSTAHYFFVNIFVLVGFALSLASFFMPAYAWGPERDVYTYDEINDLEAKGEWGNKIVLNSITDSKTGDERTFLTARVNDGTDATWDIVWNGSDITVEDGQEYWLRFYFHNNNPNGWDGVAENVRAQLSIPNVSAKQIKVSGFLSSSNATPNEYWDYVNFNSDQAFHLEYVYGSTVLVNKALGSSREGYPLSDDYYNTKDGILLGYDKLDGRLPGCYDYSGFVLARVKAVFDSDFTVNGSVRQTNHNNAAWKEEANVKVGDKIDIRLQYKNTSDSTQNDVAARIVLPDGLRFVEGSGRLINSSHPDGVPLEGDYLVSNGVVVGNYEPNESAQIILTAEVTKDGLSEINNTLKSYVQIGINSFIMQDFIEITVKSTPIALHIIDALIVSVLLGLVLTLIRKMRRKF